MEHVQEVITAPVESSTNNSQSSPKGRRLLWFLLIPLFLGASAYFRLQARQQQGQQLVKTTNALDVQPVSIVHPERGKTSSDLTLPGMIQPFSVSPVYARLDGYIRTWYVDIGAHVTKGQLLAEIDAPDVDQQLNQARGMLQQAQANLALAKVTAPRYQELIKSNSVSQQEVDQANQNLAAQEANVQAAIGAVGKLEEMQGFEKVTAPFDGIITERKTDFGDLINAGNGGTGHELFRISQNNVVRIFVNVPEEFSSAVRTGTKASLDVISLANRRFPAAVTRTADSIDPTSRTLTVELDIANPTGELLPGGYANVHFQLPLNVVPLVLPGSAILFQAAGPEVGIVNSQNLVSLRKVTLGQDFGDTIEVLGGVKSGDAVIANPADSLTNGTRVAVEGR